MAKTIAKKQVTQEAYREALQGYRDAESAANKIAVKYQDALNKAKDKYKPDFDAHAAEMEKQAAIIEEYCLNNRDELFAGKQSITENSVTMAFKKGAISVQLLEGNTEDSAVIALKTNLPNYVAVKESIDKRKLLSERADIEESDLEDCGLYFAQGEETFTVKAAEIKVK